MQAVETVVDVEDMSFLIRVWPSRVADGWFWVARAEDHELVLEGQRPWANARTATEAAVRHLVRVLGYEHGVMTMPQYVEVVLESGARDGVQAVALDDGGWTAHVSRLGPDGGPEATLVDSETAPAEEIYADPRSCLLRALAEVI